MQPKSLVYRGGAKDKFGHFNAAVPLDRRPVWMCIFISSTSFDGAELYSLKPAEAIDRGGTSQKDS